MELIWAFSKFLQYLVIAPIWWVGIQFAALFFPLEGDFRQDFVAFLFCLALVIATIGGYRHFYHPPEPPPAIAKPQENPDEAELKAQMEMIKAIQGMEASHPALAH